ncbi:unnamed protein product [Dimorphilus gyrociliatus]|uniref:18S rRNA (guanine-N(7))-methyltransferase n=1 Tax=Dimorphilus gyrociliatus TaxID=2664684 RepID=A0A7I8W7C1_9ANNE|nr:unnamed protein product [Dimorphilus gyrociliatus]
MSSGRRPEHQAPPEVFYNDDEARKYTKNTRIMEIQEQLSYRAMELLRLPEDDPCYILDVGCGSGLSGECLSENGHFWVGVDISKSMLDVAGEREVEGDLILNDIGQGLPFKPASFDGVISISAIQWLCNADKSHHNPARRLLKFFSTLYACLRRGGRVAMQFYPENSEQIQLVTTQAMKAGFTGGLVVDYPNSSKAKKMFLCLFAGGAQQELPKGLGTEESSEASAAFVAGRERTKKLRNQKVLKKSKDWIIAKKERRRRQGKEVRPDSKYTGRKRKPRF